MEAFMLVAFPSTPAESTLTRAQVPVDRSRTKTSIAPFVSFATSAGDRLWNGTWRAWREIVACIAFTGIAPPAGAPDEETLAHAVLCAAAECGTIAVRP